jgi:hypothetical protein
MSFRISVEHQKLLDDVVVALALRPTPALRFFWRKLRTAALPPIPPRGKKQTAKEYALTQLRWQRLAALAADSHVAAGSLLTQEIALEVELEVDKPVAKMSPAEAGASLLEEIRQSPLKVQFDIYNMLIQLHPTWNQDEDEDE